MKIFKQILYDSASKRYMHDQLFLAADLLSLKKKFFETVIIQKFDLSIFFVVGRFCAATCTGTAVIVPVIHF